MTSRTRYIMKFLQSNSTLNMKSSQSILKITSKRKWKTKKETCPYSRLLISINPEASSIQPFTQTEECESVTNKAPSVYEMRFTSTLGRRAFHAIDNSVREATAQTVKRDATT